MEDVRKKRLKEGIKTIVVMRHELSSLIEAGISSIPLSSVQDVGLQYNYIRYLVLVSSVQGYFKRQYASVLVTIGAEWRMSEERDQKKELRLLLW